MKYVSVIENFYTCSNYIYKLLQSLQQFNICVVSIRAHPTMQ